MKMSRRILSLVLAAALLITCGITGLVLPVSAAGDELFPNGDFEKGAVAPWTNFAADNTHWAIGDDYGVDGSKGMKWIYNSKTGISTKAPYEISAQFDSAITITEPGTYRFSFSSTLTGTTGITVTLESLSGATFVNNGANVIRCKCTDVGANSNEWVTYHADFEVTEETVAFAAGKSLTISISTNDVPTFVYSRDLRFDNFSLKKWDESEGLVLDGDFDNAVDTIFFGSTSTKYYSWLNDNTKGTIVARPGSNDGNRALKMMTGTSFLGRPNSFGSFFKEYQSYLVKFEYCGPAFNLVDGTEGKYYTPTQNQATITVPETEKGKWETFTCIYTTGKEANMNTQLFKIKVADGDPVYIDNFNIYNYDGPETLEFAQSAVEIEKGAAAKKLKLTAKAYGYEVPLPKDTTWKSNDESVATVADGKVTAVSLGQATITATSGDVTATCTVNVVPAAPKITIDEEVIGGAITVTTKDIAAGEAVTVKATPDDGYVMVPGSLKYTTADGEVKILNKASGSFGEGTGNEFAFEMPNEDVTVTAEFTQDAFEMDSIGTSVHYTDGVADGIRFLTRLNINGGLQDGVLYLDGKEVKEIGTLLKRGEANLEEMKSADPNEAGVWKTVNYTSETGAFKAVDYTEQYIDFATSMMTKNNGQYYTAVGYITFADGDTVYSNGVQADNITSAQTRM